MAVNDQARTLLVLLLHSRVEGRHSRRKMIQIVPPRKTGERAECDQACRLILNGSVGESGVRENECPQPRSESGPGAVAARAMAMGM